MTNQKKNPNNTPCFKEGEEESMETQSGFNLAVAQESSGRKGGKACKSLKVGGSAGQRKRGRPVAKTVCISTETPKICIQLTSNGLIPESEPFTKKSSIWKQFEDMEVFQKMSVKPHFRPLYEMEELLREGLAIACMVNFSNLVTRFSDFLYKDPTSLSQLIDDLEKNGFDVKALKERMDEARLMKARGEKLQEEFQMIETQITEYGLKKTQLSLEYDRIAQDKNELIAREEKIMLAMDETESIFSSLVSKAADISRETKRVERGLEVLASFPY